MFWETKNLRKITELEDDLEEHEKKISQLLEKMALIYGAKPECLTKEEKERLADLEVKMAKLWSLLIEQTPNGRDKLSKFGRRFGGQSKGLLQN